MVNSLLPQSHGTFSTLKMEAADSSGMSLTIHHIKHCNNNREHKLKPPDSWKKNQTWNWCFVATQVLSPSVKQSFQKVWRFKQPAQQQSDEKWGSARQLQVSIQMKQLLEHSPIVRKVCRNWIYHGEILHNPRCCKYQLLSLYSLLYAC